MNLRDNIFYLCMIGMIIGSIILAFFPSMIFSEFPDVPVWDVMTETRKQHYEMLECVDFGGNFNENTRICTDGINYHKPLNLSIHWNYNPSPYESYHHGFGTLGTDKDQCRDGFKYIETDWPEKFPTCMRESYLDSLECDENWELKLYSSHYGCSKLSDHDIMLKNQEKIIDLLEKEE